MRAQRAKGSPWPTGEPCQLELSGRRMVGIDSYPWEDPGEMAMAEGREIRLWGAKLGAEGPTHTSHRQGRRLGKRAENNGYAKPDLRPTQLQFQPMVCFSPVLNEAATRRKEGVGLSGWADCCIQCRMTRRNFLPAFRWQRKPKSNTIRMFFGGV